MSFLPTHVSPNDLSNYVSARNGKLQLSHLFPVHHGWLSSHCLNLYPFKYYFFHSGPVISVISKYSVVVKFGVVVNMLTAIPVNYYCFKLEFFSFYFPFFASLCWLVCHTRRYTLAVSQTQNKIRACNML